MKVRKEPAYPVVPLTTCVRTAGSDRSWGRAGLLTIEEHVAIGRARGRWLSPIWRPMVAARQCPTGRADKCALQARHTVQRFSGSLHAAAERMGGCSVLGSGGFAQCTERLRGHGAQPRGRTPYTDHLGPGQRGGDPPRRACRRWRGAAAWLATAPATQKGAGRCRGG